MESVAQTQNFPPAPAGLRRQNYVSQLTNPQLTCFDELKFLVDKHVQELIPDKSLVSRYTDENQLVRLLIARDFKVKDSYTMWEKWVKWRTETMADHVTEVDCDIELQTGKAFWHGYDKKNNPVLVVLPRLHFPGQTTPDKMIKFFLFLMKQAEILSSQTGTERVTIIWDREGFSKDKNWDSNMFSVVRQLVGILQDNYAERVEQIFILHPNWFFKTIFALLKPFMSARSLEKYRLVTKLDDLKQYIDPSNLLLQHGGESTYQYTYPPGHPVLGVKKSGDDLTADSVQDQQQQQQESPPQATLPQPEESDKKVVEPAPAEAQDGNTDAKKNDVGAQDDETSVGSHEDNNA